MSARAPERGPGVDARLALETPEQIAVGFDLAGIGHRALAYLVDLGILGVAWVCLAILAGLVTRGAYVDAISALSGPVQAVLVVAGFLLSWSYALLFEWRWSGQTPGKRLIGLRVIRTDGAPYDLLTSAVRNLARALDGMPLSTYLVGLVTVSVTAEGRRLGDLLAGTVLVKDAAVDLSMYDAGEDDGADAAQDAIVVSAEAYEMAADFLARAAHLDPQARGRVALATARSVALQAGLVPDGLGLAAASAEAFLAAVVRRPARRGGRAGADALVRFVRRRQADWGRLEALLEALNTRRLHLDELRALDRLHRRAAGDLAWAQTFFPGTAPARHLDRLCGRAYREVYRGLGDRRAAFVAFWREGLPAAVWRARREVGVAALLLAGSALAGALVTWAQPAVADLVLGPRLMHEVRSGRVWTDDLLSVMPPSLASAEILTNNIAVAFVAFAGGLTAGVFTVGILLVNGALLGVAFVATGRHGVAGRLLDFVAAHGPVELSVIVLASAAGLLVAGAIVSPGPLRRADALAVQGRDAVRIILGGAPLLFGVGLIEGFVSPGDAFPTWIKALLGLGLAATLWTWLLGWGARAAARQALRPPGSG